MKINIWLFLIGVLLFVSCGGDDSTLAPTPEPEITISIDDFNSSIDENPSTGQSIGFVNASTNVGNLSFSLLNQNPTGALSVNANSGELSVANAEVFDFETNTSISATINAINGQVTESATVTIAVNDIDENQSEFTIWSGPNITFEKADGANPSQESNQDRITDNVWITRGNDGGQIFNIAVEQQFNKDNSPLDTEWALGTTQNIGTLQFAPLRTTIRPNASIVGEDLVVHLIKDDIYIDLKFTSWSSEKQGGFAYVRSSEN